MTTPLADTRKPRVIIVKTGEPTDWDVIVIPGFPAMVSSRDAWRERTAKWLATAVFGIGCFWAVLEYGNKYRHL